MHSMPISQRAGVLLDEVNIFLHGEELYGKVRLNIQALLHRLNSKDIARFITYCVELPENNLIAFRRKMEKLGVEVKSKTVKVYSNGDRKGDWDIQICIDAIQLAQKVDTLVLASNDADFIPLVRHLRCLGVRVELVAFEEFASAELVASVDKFLPLTQELFVKRS